MIFCSSIILLVHRIIILMSSSDKPLQTSTIDSFDHFPVKEEARTCTDICCLITGISFSLVLITAAAVLFNKATFYSVNFPTDSDGKLCGYDYPQYQYLFFSNAPLINARVCVSKCPSKGDITLNCRTNSLVPSCNFNPLNKYYDSVAEKTRMGFFCYPTDTIMKQLLKQVAHLTGEEDFYNSLDSIKSSFIVAIILSFTYFVLVQALPRIMNYSIVVIAIGSICLLIIKTFLFQTKETQIRLVIASIFIVLLLLILISLCKNLASLKIHAIILTHASRMVKQRCFIIVYIIIYLILFIAFIALILFEFAGFWTGGRKIFIPAEYIYYQLYGITVSPLVILALGIQFIWGAGFLKQSYNYCISGNSISWFLGDIPKEKFQKGIFYSLLLQIKYNVGSVIGCSFFTSFFAIFDLVFDMFKPSGKEKSTYLCCFTYLCSCCYRIWDLVRSDSMSYVILSGNPICNSARYCQYLCDKSILTQYSQSCSRIYRISAHFSIAAISLLYSVFFTTNTSIYAFLVILIGSLSISTFFISMHADAAEAIQIVYLLDQEFLHRGQNELMHKKQGLAMATARKEIAQEISKQYHSLLEER